MSDQSPQVSDEQARPGSGLAMAAAAAVFMVGYFVFPPESSHWSDRGPHLMVTAVAAGAVAAIIAFITNLVGPSSSTSVENQGSASRNSKTSE